MGNLFNTTINGVSYDFKDAGAARQSHTHTKSQITDFPTSMPASDVPAWAKASTKPTYTASEVGAVPNTAAGVSAAINQLTTGDSAPTDNDYYVSQYAGGGTSTTTYHRRPVSKLWEYIKSKLASKGSATQPVYFSNGVPVATTYTLGKSVPSDAKFTDTTYSAATTSAAGLMSATDKIKLDGIATGATKTTVDSALSSTSTNPVQNKVINSALAGKASTAVATTSANGLMSSGDKSIVNALSNQTWTPVTLTGASSTSGGYMLFGKLCLLSLYFVKGSGSGIVYNKNLPNAINTVYTTIFNQTTGRVETFNGFRIAGKIGETMNSLTTDNAYSINVIYMTS